MQKASNKFFQKIAIEYKYSVLATLISFAALVIVLRQNSNRAVEAAFAIVAFSLLILLMALRSSQKSRRILSREIAEREKSEKSLRQAAMRFGELFDNANDLIYTTDLKGNFTSLNKIGEIITGYTLAEALEMNFAQVVAPEYLELAARMLDAKLTDDAPTANQIEIIAKSGNRVALDISNRLIYEGGERCGVHGIARDITTRRQVEETLRKTVCLLTSTFEATSNGIIVLDKNFDIITFNRKFLEMWQVSADAVRGQSQAQLMPLILGQLRHPSEFERKVQYLQTQPGRANFDVIEFKDGRIYELSAQPQIMSGEVVGQVVSFRDVTEQKQAERALVESQERYRRLFDSNPHPVWVYDLDTLEFLAVNDEACRRYGYTRAEFLKMTIKEIRPAEDIPLLMEFVGRARAQETEVGLSCRHLKKNGTIFDVEIASQPISFAGECARLVLATDVTERRQAEAELSRSENELRTLFSAMSDVIIEFDADGRCVKIAPTNPSLLCQPSEAMLGKKVDDLFPPELADMFVGCVRDALAAEQPVNVEYSIPIDGQETAFNATITRMTDQTVLWVARDVTARKEAEKSSVETQRILQLVMDTIPQAIWWKDKDLKYLGSNQYLADAAGFDSPDEIVGLTDYDMPWTRAEAEVFRECDRRVMESGAAELNIIEPLLQADGRQAWLNTNKAPLRDAEGKIIGVLGTFADITEQRRAEAALRESENKFRTLVESTSEGLLQVDDKDCIEFVNGRFCEMVGYSEEELIGADWSLLLLDDDGREFVGEVNKRRRQGISDRYEMRLRKKSGENLWVIIGGAPVTDADGSVSGSMGVFTDITERKFAEEQLLHDAFHDGLTGLANRTLFNNHLQMTIERARRNQHSLYAVLFLDFDRFKVINDSLGHSVGDNLLKQIARRLENSLRGGDLLARLGGDEFTILLSELSDTEGAIQVAERIQKDLNTPFLLGKQEIFISASIGISLSSGGYHRAEDMLRDADIAMYRAKAKGKAQHQVFDQSMYAFATGMLQLETEMRRALQNGEFCINYQPIISLETNNLTGFEALIRWRHPERGMISPNEFISSAEENGLIIPLGRWILYESCRQLREWQNKNSSAESLTISVNLSCKQFLQPDLAEQVIAAIVSTRLDPRSLKLEITESHLMENSEKAVMTMNRLRETGVEISLDDFGTGYSSLSYLHRLPVNYLKIDRSFVTRMVESRENGEIVYTIVKLAKNLKMKVIAEGIETADQLILLKRIGCDFGQGYFISKPLSAEEAGNFIDRPPEDSLAASDAPVVSSELNM